MKKITTLVIAAIAVLMCACNSPKQVPYLVGVDEIPPEVLNLQKQVIDPILGPGDLLNIEVSGTLPTALAPFNKGQYVNPDGNITRMSTSSATSSGSGELNTQYYLVDPNGYINFPILGEIHVSGMTKDQLVDYIADHIYPKYVTERPMVEVRLMNFRITILGAVNSPGVYKSTNERLNFLEAIAMAGDLNIKGQRENILLIRTDSNGNRSVHRINLHEAEILTSPLFNLQQNDFIYVEPNRSLRQTAWALNSVFGATSAVIGSLSSVAGLVIGVINLAK